MYRRNDGRGEINSLQNRFTAYLTVAADRCKSRYVEQRNLRLFREFSYDFADTSFEPAEEPDMLAGLPLADLIESESLLQALLSMSPRDREVLLDLIVFEMKPAALAHKLGLSYQGAMSVYYRARKKLLEKLKGGDQE